MRVGNNWLLCFITWYMCKMSFCEIEFYNYSENGKKQCMGKKEMRNKMRDEDFWHLLKKEEINAHGIWIWTWKPVWVLKMACNIIIFLVCYISCPVNPPTYTVFWSVLFMLIFLPNTLHELANTVVSHEAEVSVFRAISSMQTSHSSMVQPSLGTH